MVFFNNRLGLKWRQWWRIKGFSNEESRTIKYTFSHTNIEQFVLLINENLVVKKLRYALDCLEDFLLPTTCCYPHLYRVLAEEKVAWYQIWIVRWRIKHPSSKLWKKLMGHKFILPAIDCQLFPEVKTGLGWQLFHPNKILNWPIFKTLMAIFYKDRIRKLAHRYGKYLNSHSDCIKRAFLSTWLLLMTQIFSLYPKWKNIYIHPLCIY